MGAIEAFGMHIGEKLDTLASGLSEIAEAINTYSTVVETSAALGPEKTS